jgi:ParB family chromosome partitioning protein
MAASRSLLESLGGNLAESIGVRDPDHRPALGPVPLARDAGRRPIRDVGRVEIDRVIPDSDQPRVEFTGEAIERLAQSIREKGQLSPIRVRWSEEVGKWLIISGERRWRATRLAGLTSIDCHFHEGELSRSEVLEQQLIENLLREDLQPVEEARAFSTLMEINGWNGKQLAEAIRIPASKVSRSLALLRLPEALQERVARGEIAARSAYELSKVEDDGARADLADKAAAGSMTHDDLARAARGRKGKPAPKPRNTRVTLVCDGGWRVVVSAGRKGTYDEVELALVEALEEVRTRIRNNVQLF